VWLQQGSVDEDDDEGSAGETGGGIEAGARKQQRPPKVLADVVEALVGASLVDAAAGRGELEWGSTWAVLQRLLPDLQCS
jgi:hypothetical protein